MLYKNLAPSGKTRKASVLISGCHNKLPKTGQHKQQKCTLSAVLEARDPKSGISRAGSLWRPCGAPSTLLSWLLAVPPSPWCVQLADASQISTSFPQAPPPPCWGMSEGGVTVPKRRTPLAQGLPQGSVTSFNLITSAKTPFPIKVIFISTRSLHLTISF